MTPKHTPGPWKVEESQTSVQTLDIVKIGEHGREQVDPIAVVAFADLASITLSNARLIAAAPDLLSALRQIRSIVESRPPYENSSAEGDLESIHQLADTAIAGAEGKEDL